MPTFRDTVALRAALSRSPNSPASFHCAGLKTYRGNRRSVRSRSTTSTIGGALSLIEVMGEGGGSRPWCTAPRPPCTAAPQTPCVDEGAPLAPVAVYGRDAVRRRGIPARPGGARGTRKLAHRHPARFSMPRGAHVFRHAGRGAAAVVRPTLLTVAGARRGRGEIGEAPVYGADWPTADGTGGARLHPCAGTWRSSTLGAPRLACDPLRRDDAQRGKPARGHSVREGDRRVRAWRAGGAFLRACCPGAPAMSPEWGADMTRTTADASRRSPQHATSTLSAPTAWALAKETGGRY